MAEFRLEARPVLDSAGYERDGNRVAEAEGLALVSVAVPLGGEAALAEALKTAFGLAMPEPRMTSEAGEYRAIRMTPDQLLLAFRRETPDADPFVREALGGAGYTTDQTDTLVALEVSGPDALAALERICPVDLDASAFPVGASARTVMEHMGATIVRTGEDGFLLLSAASSARSFLHAVTVSFENVG